MPRHTQTQSEWELTMARRALELTRSELYLNLRYLRSALGALTPSPTEGKLRGFATDGARLCFYAPWVLELYRQNRRFLPRAYLHSVLHCVFRHLWLRGSREEALWGLACDIAVEQVIDHLNVAALARPVGWLRQKTYGELAQSCKLLAAGPIYRALCGKSPEELQKLHREFYCDSHSLWPADTNAPQSQMLGRQWEQLGRQTQMEWQQAGRQAGESAGAEALQAQVQAGRSRRTYKEFLRRFAVWREEAHLDPDEFDLGYYTYGL
ncbi:MAG: metallopeptidase, partial [Gemmiger sp.]